MQKGRYISALLRSPKTVLTAQDITLLWSQEASHTSLIRLNYYVRKGDLIRIRKGIYVKDGNYNRLELASRVFTPAYVSFETVLAKEGLIFQLYEPIFAASYISREIEIDGQKYVYKKIKNNVLTNSLGINQADEISIASAERAFLDTLYIDSDYHFDNLRSLNWEKVLTILPLYANKSLAKKVKALMDEAKKA
jgi:predicted transcriptional regulator of viral defense system